MLTHICFDCFPYKWHVCNICSQSAHWPKKQVVPSHKMCLNFPHTDDGAALIKHHNTCSKACSTHHGFPHSSYGLCKTLLFFETMPMWFWTPGRQLCVIHVCCCLCYPLCWCLTRFSQVLTVKRKVCKSLRRWHVMQIVSDCWCWILLLLRKSSWDLPDNTRCAIKCRYISGTKAIFQSAFWYFSSLASIHR